MYKARAIELYRKAAECGYKEAEASLGLCYKDGNGVELNYAEAFKWFT